MSTKQPQQDIEKQVPEQVISAQTSATLTRIWNSNGDLTASLLPKEYFVCVSCSSALDQLDVVFYEDYGFVVLAFDAWKTPYSTGERREMALHNTLNW